MEQLTPEQLKEQIDNDTPVVLLDVREAWEYELCHIDGSINIAMSQIPSTSLETIITEPTVVICHHGIRSMQVAQYLENKGFNHIINLAGGIDAWATSIDKTMPTY